MGAGKAAKSILDFLSGTTTGKKRFGGSKGLRSSRKGSGAVSGL